MYLVGVRHLQAEENVNVAGVTPFGTWQFSSVPSSRRLAIVRQAGHLQGWQCLSMVVRRVDNGIVEPS